MKFDSPRLLTVLMRNGAIAPDLIRTASMKFRMNQRDIGKHAASGMPVKLVPVKIGAVLGFTNVLANAASSTVPVDKLAPLITGGETNVLIPEILSLVDVCTKLLDNAPSGMPVKLVPVSVGAVLGLTNVLANAASATAPFGTVNVPDKSRFRKLRSVVLLITACFPAKSVVRAAT